MAKRIIDWVLAEDGVLSLNKYNSDKEAEVELQASFDLKIIHKHWNDYGKVEKHTVEYGVKQQLADAGASEKELSGKVLAAQARWELWLTGETSAPRANATGSSENKKIVANVKEILGTVSLQGLMLKQMMTPEKFTEADAAKLQEFMELKFEESVRNMPENKNRK